MAALARRTAGAELRLSTKEEETKVTKRSILAVCFILGLSAVVGVRGAHAQNLTPITISYQPTNYWALPYYVATKKGWWKDVGLDPKFVLFPAGIPQVA